jgi:hypothetical protein
MAGVGDGYLQPRDGAIADNPIAVSPIALSVLDLIEDDEFVDRLP